MSRSEPPEYDDGNLTVGPQWTRKDGTMVLRLRDDEGQTVALAFIPGILWSYLQTKAAGQFGTPSDQDAK